MQIYNIDLKSPNPEIIDLAAKTIETGGIVIHPTDTAYGLAANIFNPQAIAKIFAIKGRDFNKKLITCVRDLDMAQQLAIFNSNASKLFEKFLPGAITLVLPSRINTDETIAIRIPNCKVTLDLSKICPVPYSTTSANLSGMPNPYSKDDILSQFTAEALEKIDLFLDAGPLPPTPPSTIVALTTEEPKILRAGPISSEEIFSFLKQPKD